MWRGFFLERSRCVQDADYVDFQDATAEHVDQLRRNVATFTEACRRVLDERLRAEDSPAE